METRSLTELTITPQVNERSNIRCPLEVSGDSTRFQRFERMFPRVPFGTDFVIGKALPFIALGYRYV